MEKPQDFLGKPRPNKRETNVGATKATPELSVKDQNKVTGVRLHPTSSRLENKPCRARKSGNNYKAKPGAK